MIEDMKYIPVEGHPNLFRDAATGAIINNDKSKAAKARATREKILKEKKKSRSLNLMSLKSKICSSNY